tara:strand:- start:473 stop:880 length:408 start_codon:yes stop_codon:yes gene_type:complete
MNNRTPVFNPEAHKLVKEAMAEKLYKIQNDKGWEIYFRPFERVTDKFIEVITFFQGDPFVNPRRLDKDMSNTNTKDNIEVWSVEEARDAWGAWVEHSDFEQAEVEDFLKGGRSEWAGESFNYRKESKSASWCIPE